MRLKKLKRRIAILKQKKIKIEERKKLEIELEGLQREEKARVFQQKHGNMKDLKHSLGVKRTRWCVNEKEKIRNRSRSFYN